MSLLTIEANIKSHLVAIVVVALLVAGSVYGVESLVAHHDAANDAKWAALLAQNDAKSKSDEAQLQALVAQVSAENVKLSNTIVQRDAQLTATRAQIATAPAAQVATDVGGTLVNPTTVQLPIDTARSIDLQLAMLPVVEANLSDETKIAQNLQTQIVNTNLVVTDLKTQIDMQTKACQAQVTDVKAKARKSKFRWFLGGFIAGFTLGHIY